MSNQPLRYERGVFLDPPEPSLSKRGRYMVTAVALVAFLAIGGWLLFPDAADTREADVTAAPASETLTASAIEITPSKSERMVRHIVAEGDIPADVFAEYGNFDANDMAALLAAAEGTYDFTSIRIGRPIEFVFTGDGNENTRAEEVRYFTSTENMVIASLNGDTFRVEKKAIPYETHEETIRLTIDEFLYKDGLDAGLSEASILEIADIFSFDVDFTTEIREGDSLVAVIEKRTLDGEPAPDGAIIAAQFTNAGESYRAYHFESDGEGSHYDADGRELMRQFLRAPLSYRKITSGFTGARRHPITKTVSAHYQIDYAAPTGTPVVATGRGTVTSAGWEGGWGNIVRIRHDNGYTTHYGHLSSFAKGIRSGATVAQGETVGFVGSTGWSTGPHLDYGMRLEGKPVNPLALKLPKGTALAGDQLAQFQSLREKLDILFE